MKLLLLVTLLGAIFEGATGAMLASALSIRARTPPACFSRQSQQLQMLAPADLYDTVLVAHPMLTKCLTSSVLFGFSDVLAQVSESAALGPTPADAAVSPADPATIAASEPLNIARVVRFMLTGIGSGICWHHWFGFEQQVVDDLTAGMQEGSTLLLTARTVLGIALEQFVMIPFYFSLYLIPVVSLQNGVRPSAMPDEVRGKLPGLFVNNAKVIWTPRLTHYC